MDRIIIIPDIHYRLTVVNSILDREYQRATKIIFLGDYFDTQDHSHEMAAVMAFWLKGVTADKKCLCLLGNHDMQYLYPKNTHFSVKGYDPAIAHIVSSIITPEDIKRFALHYFHKTWLFSHAGIHPGFLSHRHGSLRSQARTLEREAFLTAAGGGITDFLEAGQARRGMAPYGGVTWLDFEDEFLPVHGINQVVGHTRGTTVRCIQVASSRNYCLDAMSRYYGVLSGSQFQIYKSDTGKPLKAKEIEVLND